MEDFILRALAASLGVSVIAGSLGCFVIWKRLSYFSDSISHSALLGVALGLATGLGINFGLVIVGALFAILIVVLQQKDFWSNDAILGIFSHIALSVGIVVLGFVGDRNTDYFAYLFGDILSINSQDIFWIFSVMAIVCSKWDESVPSFVTTVQSSSSINVSHPPIFNMGSIAMHIPGFRIGPGPLLGSR